MLVTRRSIINERELDVIEWSGNREDEAELRKFCGDRLHYVRDDGVAAIGDEPFVTEIFAGKGDLLVKPVEAEGPLLRLPGNIHWAQVLFGP